MEGRGGSAKKTFNEILEEGAQVDDIFKAAPPALGTDPYDRQSEDKTPTEGIQALEVIEASRVQTVAGTGPLPEAPALVAPPKVPDEAIPGFSFVDNGSFGGVNRKLAVLDGLFKLVNRDCSFGEMTSEILRIAMEQIKSEAGALFEVDYQNQCMFFRAVTGRSSESLLSVTIPRGQGVIGFVCEHGEPLTLSKVDDTIYLKAVSSSVGFDTRNCMAFPVIIRGATFGCLELLNRIGEEKFSDEDKQVMAAICDAAARLIENRLVNAVISKELESYRAGRKGEAA